VKEGSAFDLLHDPGTYANIQHMKRTTIFIEESVEKDLQALARRERRTTSALIREALARYVGDEKRRTGGSLRIIGMGRSGHRDTAEKHEELLWSGLEPHADEGTEPERLLKQGKKRRARGRTARGRA